MQTESCLFFFLRPHTAFIFVWNILGIYSKYSLQFSLTFIFKDTLKKKTCKTGSNMATARKENRINQSPQLYIRSRASFPSQGRFLTTLHDSLHRLAKGIAEV